MSSQEDKWAIDVDIMHKLPLFRKPNVVGTLREPLPFFS